MLPSKRQTPLIGVQIKSLERQIVIFSSPTMRILDRPATHVNTSIWLSVDPSISWCKNNPEAKSKDQEIKPAEEPNSPKIPQQFPVNLDSLREKANKERQDRKAEHLSEVEKLAKSKSINNDDVRELLHVSQSTATNYLEELTKQGKLKKSGKAKGTTYS